MSRELHPTVELTIGADPTVVRVDDGQLTLDSGSVPYATADATIPLTPSLVELDVLDPRDDIRVVIAAGNTGHWDTIPATYTPWIEARRNQLTNPNFAVDIAYWAPTRTRIADPAPYPGGNGFSLQVARGASDTHTMQGVQTAQNVPVVEGDVIHGIFRIKAVPGANVKVGFRVNTGTAVNSVEVPSDGEWHELHTYRTATADATIGLLANCINSDVLAGGAVMFYIDSALLEVNTDDVYFDGSTPDAELAQYSWTAAANASASLEETREIDVPAHPVWVPDPPRLFDLGLRSRTIDDVAKTVSVVLASDEARLMDRSTLVVDSGARAHEASLRGVVDYVLAKIGAALEAGGPDADVTAYWDLTNYVTNPHAQVDLAGWVTATGNATMTRSATGGPTGGPHLISTANGSGSTGNVWSGTNPAGGATSVVSAKAGQQYTASMYLRASAAGKTARVALRFTNSTQYFDVQGPLVAITNTSWTRVSVTAVCPDGFTFVSTYCVAPTFTAGQALYNGAAMITDGAELVPFFDGRTVDDTHYLYDWGGTADQSASTRRALVDRPPELFVWKPGTTAWDFLQPLLTPSTLKLFCDENRVWRMVDPASYEVPGFVTVHPANTTSGADTISRDDSETFVTGVVCRYAWEDTNGVGQIAYDAAGTPDKVLLVDFARAYPGPGGAAAILARRNGTGRTQAVTVLAEWATTPGMVATISLLSSPQQLGKLTDVQFSLGDDSVMDLGTRTLIDIQPGAIDLLPGTIDALVGTIDAL